MLLLYNCLLILQMDNCYLLAFWIVALICLIAIATALTSMAANNYSFMDDKRDRPATMRFAGEPSDNISRFAGDGQNERPIFYDIGDASAINKHMQAVKADKVEGFDPRVDKNKLSPDYLSGVAYGRN